MAGYKPKNAGISYVGAGISLLSLLMAVALMLWLVGREAESVVGTGANADNAPIQRAKDIVNKMNQRSAGIDKSITNEPAPVAVPAIAPTPVAPAPVQPAPLAAPAVKPAASGDPGLAPVVGAPGVILPSASEAPAVNTSGVKKGVPAAIHSAAEDELKEMSK